VAGLCGLLASEAGAPIRIDGLMWLAPTLDPKSPTVCWHRERMGNSLVELLDTIVAHDSAKIAANTDAREVLIKLAAQFVSRQVPAAVALQERIRRSVSRCRSPARTKTS
jgi:hypothetical protein